MKLKFRDDMLNRYSFKDLEYGLTLLRTELSMIEHEMNILIKWEISNSTISRIRTTARTPTLEKIAIIENELGDRMLTGNDDGMLERELLGVNNE
jgi:hypothetical protein